MRDSLPHTPASGRLQILQAVPHRHLSQVGLPIARRLGKVGGELGFAAAPVFFMGDSGVEVVG